ncbi:DUF2306 domain-containing protein [Actibacterium pelagium]|uniref:DUF2306 domain-containing protein n=1 Tax=Actibacterium pelagium TaxID=2029103 RepID=A0A917EJ00_9RHOB|nr:DUF2306 domain-containing protein [Actibacterium pelagium]GGE46977.1 hypothetical protein GCM10011517_13400 [Actibacterium pelagium]
MRQRDLLLTVSLSLLAVLVLPFVLRAFFFGYSGLSQDLSTETYLFTAGAPFSNGAIFIHMVSGALLTVLAPLQLLLGLRRLWPKVHRVAGYLIFGLAILTGFAGLTFIFLRGTIGGTIMDVGFALYGVCLLVCAFQTVRYARKGSFEIHRQWALRTFVLAVGSWLYRVHYTVWYILTGGVWSLPDFSGTFDRVQVFAFYLPYLLLLEVWFRTQRRRSALEC